MVNFLRGLRSLVCVTGLLLRAVAQIINVDLRGRSGDVVVDDEHVGDITTCDPGFVLTNCDGGITSLSFPNLLSANKILILYTTGLQSMDFPLLVNTTYELVIQSNPKLTNFTLPSLLSTGSLMIANNGNLEEANFPDLKSTKRTSLLIYNNPKLTTMSLPSLLSTGTYLQIQSNPKLTNFTLPSLLSTGDDVNIYRNDNLKEANFPALVSIGSGVTVQENPLLTVLALPALCSVAGSVFSNSGNNAGLVVTVNCNTVKNAFESASPTPFNAGSSVESTAMKAAAPASGVLHLLVAAAAAALLRVLG